MQDTFACTFAYQLTTVPAKAARVLELACSRLQFRTFLLRTNRGSLTLTRSHLERSSYLIKAASSHVPSPSSLTSELVLPLCLVSLVTHPLPCHHPSRCQSAGATAE